MTQPIKQLYIKDLMIILDLNYKTAWRLSKRIRAYFNIEYRTTLKPQEFCEFMDFSMNDLPEEFRA